MPHNRDIRRPATDIDDHRAHRLVDREACAEGELTEKNVSLAYVGKGQAFAMEADLASRLAALQSERGGEQPEEAAADAAAAGAEPMAEG